MQAKITGVLGPMERRRPGCRGRCGESNPPGAAIGGAVTGVAASLYVIERLGHVLERVFAGPAEFFLAANENARKFEQSISGVVGGMTREGRE